MGTSALSVGYYKMLLLPGLKNWNSHVENGFIMRICSFFLHFGNYSSGFTSRRGITFYEHSGFYRLPSSLTGDPSSPENGHIKPQVQQPVPILVCECVDRID